MPTSTWYPATGTPGSVATADAPPDVADGPFPLVVFAHGFANTPASYGDLLARWASSGYVVVAPEVPLLNADAPGGPSHADYGAPNIADLAFVLDQTIRGATTAGDAVAELGDASRVAVAGHSDGEILAYALALEACCHDDRVGAAVLLAGDLGNARSLPAPTGVPVLHVLSERDEYNSYGPAIAFDREHLAAPSYTLTLRSAPHGAPFEDANDPHFDLVAQTGVDFLDAYLKGAADGAARLDADVAAEPDLATLEARTATPPEP
jgi:dienelactone hydrolase